MPIEGPPIVTLPPIGLVGKIVASGVAREIGVPFTFNSGGGVSIVTDPDIQLRQHVDALMRTIPGERVMKPLFGVSMLPWVFENISPADLAVMQQSISDGFDAWIPSARLVSLKGIAGPSPGVPEGTVIISLSYSRRYDANPIVISADIPVVNI